LLRDGILSAQWNSLSGGERQRAAIAMGLLLGHAIAEKRSGTGVVKEYPLAVLLLDEPTAACDAVSCEAVEKALLSSGLAMILTTHDERQALRLAHRRVMLRPL
jgi:ABC-type iron transport system FetAB ATPase subunit